MEKSYRTLISTFRNSIKTWDYFVNWNKVFANSSDLEIALNKLNYLLGKDDIEVEFKKLYNSNPDIVRALPVLLAVRDKKLEVFDKMTKKSEFFDFISGGQSVDIYLNFLRKSGLIKLFQKDGIKNLVDYVVGVEVGLESHGRKNRGGKLMEKIVEAFISDFCKSHNYQFMVQATASKMKKEWDVNIIVDKSERRFDCAVFNPLNKHIKLFEANFFNGSGSKLKSVCGEFRSLYDELKKQGIDFIWVTDGSGWYTTEKPLEETYNHNEFVFNLQMLEKGVLSDLVW